MNIYSIVCINIPNAVNPLSVKTKKKIVRARLPRLGEKFLGLESFLDLVSKAKIFRVRRPFFATASGVLAGKISS
jgi:hypothetical protein